MHDGFVLYVTPLLCKTLGYPEDAWIGKAFIDLLHPMDKSAFADFITQELATVRPCPTGTKTQRKPVAPLFWNVDR